MFRAGHISWPGGCGPRCWAARRAGLLTWGVCALLGALLGSDAGRPPIDALAGLNTGYPVTQLAVTIAVVAIALAYLSRPVHRLVSLRVAVAALAAVSGGYALPVNAVSSLVLGWGVAAALHLAVGAFLFAQLPVLFEAWALIGAVVGRLPFGRCVALETSNTTPRWPAATWPYSPSGNSGGGHEEIVWIVLAVILVVGIALTLVALVPRLRRMASRQIRPHLVNI